MSLVLDVFSVVAIVAGGFFYLAGTVGLLPQVGSLLAGRKLLLVWLLVRLSSAAVSQLSARSVRRQDPRA